MSQTLEGHVYGSYEVYFDKFIVNTKTKQGRKRFGYVPEINLSSAAETLEGYNPDEGTPIKVAEVQTSVTQGMSFTCESIDSHAIAAALLGSESVFAQSPTPVVDEAISMKQGYTYQLGAALGYGMGVRNVASVVVTGTGGTPTHVLGTNYTLDAVMGTITWLTADAAVLVDYTPADEDREVILSGSVVHEGELFLRSNNPSGTLRDVLLPYVKLTLNGDWPLKSDNAFQQLPFSVAVNQLNSSTPLFVLQGRA